MNSGSKISFYSLFVNVYFFIIEVGTSYTERGDMKTDKFNIRPIFHINEAQTRGHVFVCMFSYAIVKELETSIYPWLDSYNKKNNCKLSYRDITDELNNIKVSELEIGHKIQKILVPELNEIQNEITKLFNIKIGKLWICSYRFKKYKLSHGNPRKFKVSSDIKNDFSK
jgi:hypothetical protein